MDVEIPLQLIADGLAEQLHAVVGGLSILLCARADGHSLRGVIVGGLIAQRATRLAPGTFWRAGASTPPCTATSMLTHIHLHLSYAQDRWSLLDASDKP